jgi:secreted trypsin-like serine protease
MIKLRPLVAAALALALLPASASAVVGGQNASRPYPHMAILKQDGSFVCGASLIAPDFVLTAAHCVVDSRDFKTPLAPSRLSFTLGTTNVSSSGGETIGASEVVVHERFTGDASDGFDVALVRLSRSSAQAPIRIASPATQRATWPGGARAWVIGYGANVPLLGISYTSQLQEVEIPIVDDGSCADADATRLCAGELYGIKDSCNGDSGGPLMVGDGNGGLLLVGTVSYGFECGIPTQYGVYGRVADTSLYEWIVGRVPAAAPQVAPVPVPAATPAPAATPQPKAKPKKKAKKKKKKAKRKRASCKTKKAKKLKRCRKAKRK